MNSAHPNTHQLARDVVDDHGLADHDDRVGTGPHAVHDDELVAS